MAHQAVTRAQIVINLKTNLVLTRKTAISKLIEGGKRKSISLAPESKKGKQVFEALKPVRRLDRTSFCALIGR